MFVVEETHFPPNIRSEYVFVGKVLIRHKSAMSGSRSRSAHKRKDVGPTEEEYMSPHDVEDFRTDIVKAGARLADLLVVPYPDAHLVDDALFTVTEIVEYCGLKGRWVTSWASSACKEFLATEEVRGVSGCGIYCYDFKVRIVHVFFGIDCVAGGHRLC